MTNTQRLAEVTADNFALIFSLISMAEDIIQVINSIQTTGLIDLEKYLSSNI